MTTALDTNVIIALWKPEAALNRSAREALDRALSTGDLVVCGIVYAELMAAPGRTEEFLDTFFADTGIRVEWATDEKILRAAGREFQAYAARRRRSRSTAARRIVADFLIGAHAWAHGYRLLTLDADFHGAAFPNLDIVQV